MNKVLKTFLIILCSLFFVVAIYLAYVFLSYKRVEDFQILHINKSAQSTQQLVNANKEYKALSYNIGFAAYLHDFSFFMDGGTQSWAKSKESVEDTTNSIADFVQNQNADFVGLQEVDLDSTRTYQVDETNIIENKLSNLDSTKAVCFDSPFLFWPILQPHGKNISNIMSFSKFAPVEAIRRQLPVDNSVTKILDYDRCYSKIKYNVDNGKNFYVYVTHMSAYAKDPSTSNKQIEILTNDMNEEANKGNYAICISDFNKQIVDNPQNYFPEYKIEYQKPFPKEYLEGTNVKLVAPFNPDNPVGSMRDAGVEYSEDVPVANIDGFLATKNIEIEKTDVIDTHFDYSDHNPVYMVFKLKN